MSGGGAGRGRVVSAGLLLFRVVDGGPEVLIGHMGGPFWARKDAGAWSIPKGETEPGEDLRLAAAREFAEELGSPPPAGAWLELGEARQSTGKIVTAFAVRGEFDPATAVSNTFELEWPRGSGRVQAFPEIDRVAWFDVATARTKLVRGQVTFLDRLLGMLNPSGEAQQA
ncbi:NUDIX domain-containing protein [Frankia sp. AgB1.9]|uniref:NUDIX domain-containing protein n=1 Tax=unclassified Frankia TaxID=2632575 RepID=UPI0019349B9A|nr:MULTISPECIES: NUDIX domain-containing protein [unclassified Frankia]MBL7489892.1 NUDIX domain-containing protein [Frankia sp. AgW1.1]MBL7550291.1 NUDIX domain-containing protein [Frankia sp. AgB1.9]MBL7619128.1 NUDIX domain-containing protein [Frankia sp. AgB1.8]